MCGCSKNKTRRNNTSSTYIGRAVSAAANPLFRSAQANAAFNTVTVATNNERKRIEALRTAAIRQQFGR